MSPRPTFDYEEARRLYATGDWSLSTLAAKFGVSDTRIWQILDPERQQRVSAKAIAWTRANYRTACARCGARIWRRGKKPVTGLCMSCLADDRRTAIHGTESRYTGGCRCDQCREASNAARRARRAADPERQRAYDREYKRRVRI